ncbi:MAG: tetratricopeptide repeat protein [Polyangiaceae bacterium]|nr:tetratricopeptide repeat protein [Polyangiaceae bacterium]
MAPFAISVSWVLGCAAGTSGARERAALLAERGRVDEAIAVVDERLRAEPGDVAARRLLVRLYALSGDGRGVEREVAELGRRLGARSPIPWLELGHALELQHRYDEALEAYDRAAAADPTDPAGPRTAGPRAARWGELSIAEPRLVEALRRRPGDAECWHTLGFVRLRRGDLVGARAAYGAGLRADPRRADNRVGLATIAVLEGDAGEALAQYDALLALRPGHADAHLGRSWALLELERLDEAARALAAAERAGAAPAVVARQRAALAARRARAARAP